MLFAREKTINDDRPWSAKYAEVSDLASLKKAALQCDFCQLRKDCTQVVFGRGYSQADIMLIGEGPGREEDQQGAPFVGRAGRLLTKILAAAGLKEEELYISNVIKCRPRGNRTPERSEMQNCLPFLAREIELVQPVLVCLMGSVALRGVLNPEGYITRERGNWVERSGIYFIPTFHPAALLRDEKKKVPVWHDFQSLKKAYDRYRELKAAGSWPPE